MEEDSEEEAEKAKANYKLKNFAVKLKKTNYVSKMNNSRKDFRLGLSKFSKVTDKVCSSFLKILINIFSFIYLLNIYFILLLLLLLLI